MAGCFYSALLSKTQVSEAATGGVSVKKGVLRNFAKFTGKQFCFFWPDLPRKGRKDLLKRFRTQN